MGLFDFMKRKTRNSLESILPEIELLSRPALHLRKTEHMDLEALENIDDFGCGVESLLGSHTSTSIRLPKTSSSYALW